MGPLTLKNQHYLWFHSPVHLNCQERTCLCFAWGWEKQCALIREYLVLPGRNQTAEVVVCVLPLNLFHLILYVDKRLGFKFFPDDLSQHSTLPFRTVATSTSQTISQKVCRPGNRILEICCPQNVLGFGRRISPNAWRGRERERERKKERKTSPSTTRPGCATEFIDAYLLHVILKFTSTGRQLDSVLPILTNLLCPLCIFLCPGSDSNWQVRWSGKCC